MCARPYACVRPFARVRIRGATLSTVISLGGDVPEEARDVLGALARHPAAGRPTLLKAERVLKGGRTSATVFELTAHLAEGPWRFVVKMASADEAATEWEARRHFAGRTNTLCVPIEFATPGAEDRSRQIPGRPEAVVYGHAEYFSGHVGEPLLTLEELATRAYGGPEEAVDGLIRTIAALGTGMRTVFYAGAERQAESRSLRDLVTTLGTCLTLEVDRLDGDRLTAGPHPPGDRGLSPVSALYRGEAALTQACLDPDADRGTEPDLVYLGKVTVRHRDGTFNVHSEDHQGLRIEVRPAGPGLDLHGVDGTVHLVGRVVGRYADSRWAMISRSCPDLIREGQDVVQAGERTLLPFAHLLAMLTAEEENRPVSLVHGDLNTRNVLVVGGRPMLIDFARTETGKPLAGDFAWLELGLLREVFAERHGFAETLLLQRMLALASRAVEGVHGGPGATAATTVDGGGDDTRELAATAVEAAFTGVLHKAAPGLVPVFRILWAVRAQMWRSYPPAPGPPWWRDHLAHLTICANRMFKWPEDAHTPAQLRATVAAAGVASEAWGGQRPFRRWDRGVLRAAGIALIDRSAPDLPEAVETIAEIVREVEQAEGPDPLLEEALERRRDALVRAVFGGSARELLLDEHRRARHEEYLPLTAYDERGRPPGRDVQDLFSAERLVALAGAAHSGKTTVLDELCHRLAHATVSSRDTGVPLRIPLRLDPRDLTGLPVPRRGPSLEDDLSAASSPLVDVLGPAWAAAGLPDRWRDRITDLAVLGVLCLVIDDLHWLDDPAREHVSILLTRLAEEMPRLSMVVCHRRTAISTRWPGDLGAAPFRALVLAEPEPEQIRSHIARALHRSGARAPEHKAALIVDRLVMLDHDPPGLEGRSLPRGLRSPGLLPPALVLAGLHDVPDLPTLGATDLLAEYVQHLTGSGNRGQTRTAAAFPDKEPILAHIARELTDRREEKLAVTELPALLAPAGVEGWSDVVNELVDDGILEREVTADTKVLIGFALPVVREYFAARWLYGHWRDGERRLADHVTDFRWHEPIRLLIPLLDGVEAPLTELCTAALKLDLGLAVTFLLEARTPPAGPVDQLFRSAVQLLTDHGSAEEERWRAAGSLADYGGPNARSTLSLIVSDPENPSSSRVMALRALERIAQGGPARARQEARAALCEAIGPALCDEAPPELQLAALEVSSRARISGRLPRISELIDGSRPWPVTEAAMGSLRALGAYPTDAIIRRWIAACEQRLAESEPELGGLTATVSEQERLIAQRCMLLSELAAVPRMDVVLRHRFRYGVGDHVARLLDSTTDQELDSTTDQELDSMTGQEPEGTSGEPRELLDLHRRLPAHARDLVATLTVSSSATRLLQGAAALAELDASDDARLLDKVEGLIGHLAAERAEGLMEPLSALTAGVFAIDRPRGVRAALRAGLTLERNNVAGRLAWPWTMAFAHARGDPPDLIALLGEGGDQAADLAIFGLSGYGFLLDASGGPAHRLDERARSRFLARQPVSGGRAAWRHITAAATVGVAEALPFACDMVSGDPLVDATPYPVASGTYGEIESTDLGGVLAAVGYLGRIHALRGASMERALNTLLDFPTGGTHRSVALGRLCGLAYLGRWRDVLAECTGHEPRLQVTGHEPRLQVIAENAVFRWSGSGPDHAREVAAWIEERSGDLTAEASGFLRAVRHACELRSGRFARTAS